MDKRYQVFVSSTFEDLQDERKEVMQALLELDCIPAGMELFPASNDDQWSLIKRVIDDCDYYLLIVGGRYGSIGDKGISYTQMEFEYALSQDKPIISFLHKNPTSIPVGKSEQDPEKRKKLEDFRELAKKKLIKTWDTPENLGSVVSRSMVRLIKDFPAEGWVKSGSAVDEKSIHEIARLQKENNDLKEKLNAVATEPPKGSEKFAQGEDIVDIDLTFKGWEGLYESYECSVSIKETWNRVFQVLAPHMIDECREHVMINALNGLIEQHSSEILKDPEFSSFNQATQFEISVESYNTIKVQLRALGLICLSEKKRSMKDISTYWTLTPYGDFVMTQLLAIKK